MKRIPTSPRAAALHVALLHVAALAVALLAFGSVAQAHSHLRSSTPAQDSVMRRAPAQAVLEFSEVSRLTSLALKRGTEATLNLTPLPDKPARQLAVALPALGPGSYQLLWRVLATDGHVTSGSIHFTVSPAR